MTRKRTPPTVKEMLGVLPTLSNRELSDLRQAAEDQLHANMARQLFRGARTVDLSELMNQAKPDTDKEKP